MEDIDKILRKKASGYDTQEVVEEYDVVDGEVSLKKRRVTTKHVPPDVSSIKVIMGIDGESSEYDDMSEEELVAEREKLLEELKEMEDL